ncbi:MAG: hypothetical protein QW775_01170 [Ignisphaera sp.]|uniref:Uncharacterized protein n=1 Tax=Ignisphaera aggregans TaxID=334771 RepID=A0A832FW22_9CREN
MAGIPVYSGSREHSLANYYYQALYIPSEGVISKVYFVGDVTAKEILDWYKSSLAGYEVVAEYGITTISTPEGSLEWGAILFKKDREGVGIWALSGTPTKVDGKQGAVYCVVVGDIEKLISEKTITTPTSEGLPYSDQVSGEEPIQRYPGSVMLSYRREEGFPTIILIEYGTTADINIVAEWYKNELQLRGWTVKDERKTSEEVSLHLLKAQEEVGVIINAPTSERRYTLISIHYGSYRLPSKDIASGIEPIQRYPGSVMLKYYSMVISGIKMITITYGTYDSVDNVASWYRDYLTANNWQILIEQSVDEGKSFSYTKEGAVLQLTISSKTYTEIEILYQGA